MIARCAAIWGLVLAAAPAADLEFHTGSLEPAIIGRPYQQHIGVTGGERCQQNHVSLRVVLGTLPAGLRLSGAGALTGIPSAQGVFRFRVRAASPCAAAETDYALEVTGAPVLLTSPAAVEFVSSGGGTVPPPETVLVYGSWPELPYTVTTESPAAAAGESYTRWLSAQPERGRIPPPASAFEADRLTIRVDPTGLAPGVYTACVRVAAWRAVRNPCVDVRLRVTP